MLTNNPTFYPTPPELIKRMIKKIKGHPKSVLEPSAGRGDIIKKLAKDRWHQHDSEYARKRGGGYFAPVCHISEISAIEIDEDLQSVLRGRGVKVLDSNFLTFSGPDKFDLIIGNPPFDHGDLHLLKAIDIMYCGQIIFLLNAQTIKNAHTRTRQQLVQKLQELNAEIEYIEGAFKDSERPTGVEVALVDIVIERKIEDELFKDADDKVKGVKVELSENHEVATGRMIEELVLEYRQVVNLATETILDYFKNFKKVGKYIGLNQDAGKSYTWSDDKNNLTKQVQAVLNSTLGDIRKDFWRRTLELPDVTKRLTESKRKEFDHQIEQRCHMEFTEHNIRSFILNLIRGFKDNVRESILNLFDTFSSKHSWSEKPDEKNIHYYNGWKSNSAWKVNKRIVFPVWGYGGAFWDPGYSKDSGKWKLAWDATPKLHDIDIVMNYFDGMKPGYLSIVRALEYEFERSNNSTESTYFSKIIAYKKGTLHLTFANDDILRRFNIEAAKGKGWLPEDYGTQRYNLLDNEHKQVVEAFEGIDSYEQNFGRIGFDTLKLPQIEWAKEAA